jgi:exonuclease III
MSEQPGSTQVRSIVFLNVNGIRAWEKKGLLSWFERRQPDVLGLQETRIDAQALGALAPA